LNWLEEIKNLGIIWLKFFWLSFFVFYLLPNILHFLGPDLNSKILSLWVWTDLFATIYINFTGRVKSDHNILPSSSNGFGSKFFDLDWVGPFFCCSSQVRSATSGFGKFRLKIPIFWGENVDSSNYSLPNIVLPMKVRLHWLFAYCSPP